MKKLFALLITALLVAGCASNYKEPLAVASAYTFDVPGNAHELFQKASWALIAEGYAIASADPALGIISTQRRQMPLTTADVDVGSTWGIDYMKDKRTTTYVTATIQTSEGKAVIRTDIDAEYLPNDPTYGKRMKGTSKGTLEQRLGARLK